MGMYTLMPLPLTTGLPSLNTSVPKMSEENTPRAALLEKESERRSVCPTLCNLMDYTVH